MKAYILTVRASSDVQLCNLVVKLQSFGLDVEIITGIRGSLMEAGEYFRHASKVYSTHGYLLSPGELACTLGHLKIYERILSEDVSKAFVFEDDVILNNFGQEIQQVISFMNVTSSRFVHLGGQEGSTRRFKIRGHRHEVFDRFFSVPDIYFTFLIRTCGYAISQDFASRLLHVLRECPFRIDDFVSVARAFSVQSLDFVDTISHPPDYKFSLIESERALISSPDPNGVRLFQRIFKEFRWTFRFRAAGIMRRYAEWRRPTVALFFEDHD